MTGCGTAEAPRKMPSIRQAANKPAARPAGLPLSQRRRSASRTTERTVAPAVVAFKAPSLAALATPSVRTMRGERWAAAMMRSASAASLAREGSGARSRMRSSASTSSSSRHAAGSRAVNCPALARASTGQRVRSLP